MPEPYTLGLTTGASRSNREATFRFTHETEIHNREGKSDVMSCPTATNLALI